MHEYRSHNVTTYMCYRIESTNVFFINTKPIRRIHVVFFKMRIRVDASYNMPVHTALETRKHCDDPTIRRLDKYLPLFRRVRVI